MNLDRVQHDFHLLEIKYGEDIRPQNQLSAAQEQHKNLCNLPLQEEGGLEPRSSTTLHYYPHHPFGRG